MLGEVRGGGPGQISRRRGRARPAMLRRPCGADRARPAWAVVHCQARTAAGACGDGVAEQVRGVLQPCPAQRQLLRQGRLAKSLTADDDQRLPPGGQHPEPCPTSAAGRSGWSRMNWPAPTNANGGRLPVGWFGVHLGHLPEHAGNLVDHEVGRAVAAQHGRLVPERRGGLPAPCGLCGQLVRVARPTKSPGGAAHSNTRARRS